MSEPKSSVTAVQPRQQIRDMVAPGDEEAFRASLPLTTNNETPELGDGRKVRKPRSDTGQPRGSKPRNKQTAEQPELDPRFERAKAKFASLGGGEAVKKVFVMLDKPLEQKEAEDVEDYFYLVSKKANLDPSQSVIVLVLCGLILVGSLLGTRTQIGAELKKLFTPKPKPEEKTEPTEAEYEPVELSI